MNTARILAITALEYFLSHFDEVIQFHSHAFGLIP